MKCSKIRSSKKGPSVAHGFDDSGQPTKALLGFCQSLSITPEELDRIETPKGTWLMFKGVKQGKTTREILPALIQEAWKKNSIREMYGLEQRQQVLSMSSQMDLCLMGENKH